jgi:hypothetical protein
MSWNTYLWNGDVTSAVGNLDTETAAMLIENTIEAPPFTPAQVQTHPLCPSPTSIAIYFSWLKCLSTQWSVHGLQIQQRWRVVVTYEIHTSSSGTSPSSSLGVYRYTVTMVS